MTRKQRRLALIGGAAAMLSVAAGLILFALRDTLVFFHSPTEIVEKKINPGTRLRIGGLVETGTVEKVGGRDVRFGVTDTKTSVKVSYTGQLPDLFREGQGVVAEGVLLSNGEVRADSILAKHDETYMPREVADALKKQGVWKDGQPAPKK